VMGDLVRDWEGKPGCPSEMTWDNPRPFYTVK